MKLASKEEWFRCDECGHVGPEEDFWACDPEEMEGNIRLCDACFFCEDPGDRNLTISVPPTIDILKTAGRDE